ncbi:MAG: ABC transporter permease [Marinisporobacter sp.]|jgi:putative spermidine/putrescine transport system permease protein|nr:ABC transporter permease [Marinisporobacter sp.]
MRIEMRKNKELILWIFIIGILFLGVLPILLMLVSSFSKGWNWPEVFPNNLSLRAWQYIFSRTSKTLEGIGMSFKIALIVTMMNLILAVPAGDALGRYDFKGKKAIESILFMPIIVPPIVVMMGMYKTFIRLNLTESIMGVVMAHMIPTLPYMIRAIAISFRHLGFEWEEQAKMLGAGKFTRFFYVIFPFLLPGIVAGSSLTVLISFSQYIVTVFIGGGRIVTLPILMFPFINGNDQSIGAAYTIIFAIMAILSLWILDLFLKRYYENIDK